MVLAQEGATPAGDYPIDENLHTSSSDESTAANSVRPNSIEVDYPAYRSS